MILPYIRAILLGAIVFPAISCFAEGDTFASFLKHANSIDLLSTRERNVTFLQGSLLAPEDGRPDDVKSIYITFFEVHGLVETLSKKEIISLSQISNQPYDSANVPFSSAVLGLVILRGNQSGKEPLYWAIAVLNGGYLSISPIEELYEPHSNGRSGFFQVSYDLPKNTGFASTDNLWVRRLTDFIKKSKVEQNAAAKP